MLKCEQNFINGDSAVVISIATVASHCQENAKVVEADRWTRLIVCEGEGERREQRQEKRKRIRGKQQNPWPVVLVTMGMGR